MYKYIQEYTKESNVMRFEEIYNYVNKEKIEQKRQESLFEEYLTETIPDLDNSSELKNEFEALNAGDREQVLMMINIFKQNNSLFRAIAETE